jgi:hypothetical protein
VPDLAGFAARQRSCRQVRCGSSRGDRRQVSQTHYHSIVCIGAPIAHREPDHWAVDAIGAPHVGERTEKQLITAFCDKIVELSPQLVTFNGNTFKSSRKRAVMLASAHVCALSTLRVTLDRFVDADGLLEHLYGARRRLPVLAQCRRRRSSLTATQVTQRSPYSAATPGRLGGAAAGITQA